jgi:hypothetical protein
MSRLKGHTLQSEGAAYYRRDNGAWYRSNIWSTGYPGFGLCSCGASSPFLESATKRKQWHREHKAEVSA